VVRIVFAIGAKAPLDGTRSWDLWAAMDMARLWRDQGRRGQAYDLLAQSTADSLRRHDAIIFSPGTEGMGLLVRS
jgi:hypothetical protein